MLNKKIIALFALLIQLFALSVKSQTRDEPVSIQSPNVATLGLFGQYPVSYFTGVPQIGIPIYTLTDKDISLPISLSYHASGVRPDMHPGWVGLNWSLNAGGVISRTVQGRRADEFNNPNMDNGANSGYYYLHNLLNVSNWNTIDYMKSVEEQNLFGYNQENKNLDTEPDEFDFSFLNYSGKFYLAADGTWKVQCSKPVKVVFNNQFLAVPFIRTDQDGNFPSFSGFTIIAEDGTQYVFGGNTNAIEYSISFFSEWEDQWTANSWYLTQIISSNNVTTANFTYEADDWISQMYSRIHTYNWNIQDTDPDPSNQLRCSGNEQYTGGFTDLGVLIRPVYLKSIQTSNYNCVFNRSTSIELRNELSVYNNTYNLAMDGRFTFETLPYLEYNREGYITRPLTDPFPACLANLQWKELNQITINQKNGTLIKGFNLDYNNNPYERLMLTSLKEFGSDMSSNPPYLFSYIQPATPGQALPTYLADENDHYGFFNGHLSDPNLAFQDYFNSRQPNAAYLQVGTLNKITYPTGGTTDFTYEANDFSKQLNAVRSSGYTNLGTTNITGGLRIKKISSYDPLIPNPKVEKQYFYVSNYNNSYVPGNISFLSSGVLSAQIQYGFNFQEPTNKATATYTQTLFASESLLPGSINSQGSPVGYSEVVEKLNDGSYTKYFFSNFDNGYLDEPTINILPIQTAYDPYTSNDEERGKTLKTEWHSANDVLVRSDVFTYVAVNKATDFVPALHGRSFFACGVGAYHIDEGNAYQIYTYSFLPSQDTETIFDINGANPLTTVKNYYYDNPIHKQLTRLELINSKNESQTIISRYPGDMVNIGQNTPYQQMVNLNIVSPVVQKIKQLNGVMQYQFNTLYNQDPVTNLILPSSLQTQAQTNHVETRANYFNYDPSGNILSANNENGPTINYIWSNYGLYPIAKIENTDYATISAVLGGTTAINAFANSSPTNAAIASFLAPLRTDPRLQNAFITTFTYAPGAGMASSTDAKGKTINYSYDSFMRLLDVKDLNGNIVNHYSYHFSGVPLTTPVVYKNVSKSGSFYGICGQPVYIQQSRVVIYTVPAGAYTSTISQADADQQAQNDVNTNGQTYANANHTCY
jgi:hypothetical protein